MLGRQSGTNRKQEKNRTHDAPSPTRKPTSEGAKTQGAAKKESRRCASGQPTTEGLQAWAKMEF